MATLTKGDLSTTWVDIVSAMSLTAATTYILQNVGTYPIQYKEKSTAPSTTEFGHIIETNQTWSFTVGSDGIYLRTKNGATGLIAVTQTA